ncbi:gamma-glutamylcyclotransferase [Clostridiales Family XIII bacterium ASD5510]|uniref:Gamma-glutamylcyclotransferase n=1 Tax=Hominibacterium faecale TaxID=2839743 RepID=A0A9J6QZZ1_9FIRM|nr:gamma-glutamylcyclotransferase family protein [Hominibacterium faecale]MCU7381018.1 gamma-glutamylcyclotransferase [Hominibacterium faecale]
MKLYIAYGSNLNLEQMGFRCPSARVYAKGLLKDCELVYRGSKTNSHATIQRRKGHSVPVLIWEIQPFDEERLDIYEGYPRYYHKKYIMIDIDGERKKAMTYIMNESAQPGRPAPQYVQTIKQGYIDNTFDLDILFNSLESNTIECNSNL